MALFREKYVAEQLAKRTGKSAEAAEGSQPRDPEDDLYSVPGDLKGPNTVQHDVSAWMTGIVEVPLPVEYKLRNIEETELAKKRMLESANHGGRRLEEEEDASGDEGYISRAAYPRDFGYRPHKSPAKPAPEVVVRQGRNWKESKKR
jgi:hypothetical protein